MKKGGALQGRARCDGPAGAKGAASLPQWPRLHCVLPVALQLYQAQSEANVLHSLLLPFFESFFFFAPFISFFFFLNLATRCCVESTRAAFLSVGQAVVRGARHVLVDHLAGTLAMSACDWAPTDDSLQLKKRGAQPGCHLDYPKHSSGWSSFLGHGMFVLEAPETSPNPNDFSMMNYSSNVFQNCH